MPPRILGTELAVFSSFPAALTRNRVKNYHAKPITLIMREPLLSPSSQRLDFPDYFLQSPLNKSAQKIVSLTFFFSASVTVTANLPACAAPLLAPRTPRHPRRRAPPPCPSAAGGSGGPAGQESRPPAHPPAHRSGGMATQRPHATFLPKITQSQEHQAPGHGGTGSQVAFGSRLLEILLVFGGYFTCKKAFLLQRIGPYLFPRDSSDELCLQLILFNLFALLSGARQSQHADLSEM